MTPESGPDVVIVGGGFAGVTAARELTMRGRSAVLLEARDRLGGRTYTADHDGHPMELGGTWVHPAQPNVWAEINRYGMETEVFPVLEGLRQAVVSGGRVVDLSDDDVARAVEAFDKFCAPGTELFTEPYGDTWGPDPQGYGDQSMRKHLETVQVEPVLRDWVEAMCCAIAFGPLDQSAATEMFRTYALAGWSITQMMASLTAIKLVKGTRELIESIAAQATLADIRLNSPVRRVDQTGEQVRVELASGDDVSAPTAVIALPMNVLNSVEFEPRLSEIKRTAASEHHAGIGQKCYVRVKGDIGNVSVLAPEEQAVNWAVTYARRAEGSWLVVFASNPARLPMSSFDDVAGHAGRAAAAAARRRGGTHHRVGLGQRSARAGHLVHLPAGAAGPGVAGPAHHRRPAVLRRRRLGRSPGARSSTGRSRAATAPPATSTTTWQLAASGLDPPLAPRDRPAF